MKPDYHQMAQGSESDTSLQSVNMYCTIKNSAEKIKNAMAYSCSQNARNTFQHTIM